MSNLSLVFIKLFLKLGIILYSHLLFRFGLIKKFIFKLLIKLLNLFLYLLNITKILDFFLVF